MKKYIISLLVPVLALSSCVRTYDVLVVGGGCGGVSAGIQAARMGARTLIVEEGPWFGGMLTSAGVSAVDGNYNMRGGLFGEFCDSLASYYGGYDSLKTGWVSNIMFEPGVGAGIFGRMVSGEDNLEAIMNARFTGVSRSGGIWKVSFERKDGGAFSVRTGILIDGTELGDVAAAAGVPYRTGMDSRYDTGESIAPEKANDIVQDMTYVAILKDYGPDADMTVARPEGYDRTMFVNSCIGPDNDTSRYVRKLWPADSVLTYGRLPGGDRFMLNWPIEGNDYYANVIDASPEDRQAVYEKARERTLSFLYFLQTERGMKNIGIADDVFPTDDGLALIPYHREARRIEGEVLFTVDYAADPYGQPLDLYKTGIAVGDYAVDHHHGRYPDYGNLPDLHFFPIPSFNVPLGALIPAETDNLLIADKAISVSNIMNGATRLQPVVMQTGQAAGALAALAVNTGRTVKEVGTREVQSVVLASGGYIMPYIDLEPGEDGFMEIQRIGATGILRGEGRNVGWSNLTVFRTEDPVTRAELSEGLSECYPDAAELISEGVGEYVLSGEIPGLLDAMGYQGDCSLESVYGTSGLACPGKEERISRLDLAVIIDRTVNPFKEPIDNNLL